MINTDHARRLSIEDGEWRCVGNQFVKSVAGGMRKFISAVIAALCRTVGVHAYEAETVAAGGKWAPCTVGQNADFFSPGKIDVKQIVWLRRR